MNARASNHTNLSHPISILDLPTDVLRQIPTSYRIWKLLRLTCHELDNRLGDYHKHKDIHLYNDDINKEVEYGTFVDDIIHIMSGCGKSAYYSMYTNCVYCSDSDQDSDIAIDSGKSELILQWGCSRLSIYKDDVRVYYLEYDHFAKYDDEYIIVGSLPYIPIIHTREHTATLYAWIYYELPKLFSAMRVVKRLTKAHIYPY